MNKRNRKTAQDWREIGQRQSVAAIVAGLYLIPAAVYCHSTFSRTLAEFLEAEGEFNLSCFLTNYFINLRCFCDSDEAE